MLKSIRNVGVLVAITSMMFACSKVDEQASAAQDGLTILAGSELQTIEPILKQAQDKLGFPINIKYTGTIDGVEAIKSGADYSVAWFGNSKYFYDSPDGAKRIKLSEKIMFSPVIIGVKEDSFAKNGLQKDGKYTWKDIANWVKDKKMTYAMTDPAVSNTGYVALMGVVYATANKGENLKLEDVNPKVLQDFFKGQKVKAKSSKWLMEAFNADPSMDFVINYETNILTNEGVKLIPVYPVEGIVTSDYPMLLLDNKKADKYKQLVAFLKTVEVQKQLVENYKYHSFDANVMSQTKQFANSPLLIEMPFNPEAQLSDAILNAYFQEYKKPAKFAFVVDTSGSMSGEREEQLKNTVNKLLNGELGKYANIRSRESVLVVPFESKPYAEVTFTDQQKTQLNDYIQKLNMNGGTAMYDAVAQAIADLTADKKLNGDKYHYSIIVLTDGMSGQGANFEQFKDWYVKQNLKNGEMRVFAISFGDSDMKQLKDLTSLTGGNVFDGTKSLNDAFREIRTYQ